MTKIKICGITNIDDALAAAEYGADFLGFIFYEPSPRYVEPQKVAAIISALRDQQSRSQITPQCVGVFVNEPLRKVNRILSDCQLDRVQLHGEESPEFVLECGSAAFKVIRPKSQQDADELFAKYLPAPPSMSPPHILLEAYHPNLYGGTGRVADWAMAAKIAAQHPIMLAGSLTSDNVAEAIQVVRPWAVDASSGVEAEKGRKDHAKIKAFVEAVYGVTEVK